MQTRYEITPDENASIVPQRYLFFTWFIQHAIVSGGPFVALSIVSRGVIASLYVGLSVRPSVGHMENELLPNSRHVNTRTHTRTHSRTHKPAYMLHVHIHSLARAWMTHRCPAGLV